MQLLLHMSFFSTIGIAAWEVVPDHCSGDLWLCTWLWTLGSPWDLTRVSWRQPLLCRAGKQLQGPQQLTTCRLDFSSRPYTRGLGMPQRSSGNRPRCQEPLLWTSLCR